MMATKVLFLPLLVLHIASGLIALMAGLVAMASRKRAGGLHALTGQIYYLTMSTMAITAAILTFWEPDRLTLGAAIWTFYLVQTARNAALNRTGELDRTARWLIPVGAAATVIFLHGGTVAASSDDGEFQGMATAAFFVFGSFAMLGLVFDLSLVWRNRLSVRQRIARHLWRMVAAYFLAATSLFLGQQDDVFPFMAGSLILFLPSLLTLGFLIYWIAYVRFARNWPGNSSSAKGNSNPLSSPKDLI